MYYVLFIDCIYNGPHGRPVNCIFCNVLNVLSIENKD